MIFNDVVKCFEAASYPVEVILSDSGCFAASSQGGRIIAVAPAPEQENFLFNPIAISNTEAFQEYCLFTAGAPGGDRLWISPEYAYFWHSEPKDTDTFSNYSVARHIDPGHYSIMREQNTIKLCSEIAIIDHRSKELSEMSVQRVIAPAKMDVDVTGISYAGYAVDQSLNIHRGMADLWNIAQLPPYSILIIPLLEKSSPMQYFNTLNTRLYNNACVIQTTGKENAKIGYGKYQSTGCAAAFSRFKDELSMVLKIFPVIRDQYYCDGLFIDEAGDQVVQAWDGFGFCELEHHSIAASTKLNTKVVTDKSYLYGFRGPADLIVGLAQTTLNIQQQKLKQMLSLS